MPLFRPARFLATFTRPGAARGSLARWIHGLGHALDGLVFPWSCLLCGMEGSSAPFCRSCRRDLLEQSVKAGASACPRCALPVGPHANVREGCSDCRGRSLGFDASIAFGPYDPPIRDLCLQLKHEQNAWLASWLSDLLAEARSDVLGSLPPDTWIVPLPLHPWRYWQRGYDQAEALAHGLARRLQLPLHRPLRRVVATRKLAELGATARSQVMHRAFRIRHRWKLTGRTVLLVDDVLTTGATCGDAARELKRAGAARVIAVVIARAEKKSS
jgi:ComF family protein